jgi:hypothetical protein
MGVNEFPDKHEAHHLMPRPSPRKLGMKRDQSDSPDREQSQMERSFVEELEQVEKQKRRINKKILMEIQKHVKDEAQQKHIIMMLEESLAKPLEA